MPRAFGLIVPSANRPGPWPMKMSTVPDWVSVAESVVSVPEISTKSPNFSVPLPSNAMYGRAGGAGRRPRSAPNLIAIVMPPTSMTSSNVFVVVLMRHGDAGAGAEAADGGLDVAGELAGDARRR